MTADQILILFEQSLTTPGGVIWLADQLLVLAQHAESFSLEETDTELFCNCGESSVVLPDSYKRLFRPLLARLAKVAADESGTPFQPYGGNYELRRAGDLGPVLLDLNIANTTGERSIRVNRQFPIVRALPAPINTIASMHVESHSI